MNKKNWVEIGQIGYSHVWVSKDNKEIWRYDIEDKKMYKENFETYCNKYLKFMILHWDKFRMFHDKLINAKDNLGNTALILACRENKIELTKLLIKKGVNVNEKDNLGLTALMWTSHYNNEKLLKLLIKNGANVSEKNNFGFTALFFASIENNIEIAKILIENGANVNEKSNNKTTALTLAYYYNNTKLANLLIEKGAK